LPKRDTSFIGRTDETETIVAALEGRRLVTLAGAAGVGKTSLAIHAAGRVTARFPDGVWLVEIARLTDESHVASAVARELNIIEPPAEPITPMLASRLSLASVLLVLDGCEHLVAAVAAFANVLLHATAGVHLLVTTREPLSLRAEHLLRVAPLATPPLSLTNIDDAQTFAAIALFADRAQQVQAGFRLDGGNIQIVADICRRLDGIPLAIELAAAQLKMLSARQIAQRLEREFADLTSGQRDILPHHKTLKATLDWSYDSLIPAEQLLLVRLSAFAGSFTLEAAEEMCCGGLLEPVAIVEVLGRLIDTSLVLVSDSDPVRYRVLEPIAQYARARLPEHDDPDAVLQRHADYFFGLAEEAEEKLLGRDQVFWMRRLDQERYNILKALTWLHDRGDGQGVLRMVAALRLLWWLRRDVAEGTKWLDRALADRDGAPPGTVVRVLNGAALLGIRRLDFERAERWLQEALELCRDLDDAEATSRQLACLAVLAWFRDDDDAKADALAAEVQARHPDWWTLAWMLALRGTLARIGGKPEAAETFLGESHRILLGRGGSFDLGWSYLRLGALAKDQGLYALATQHLQEGRILLAEAGDSIGLAHADAGMGALAWLRGDREQAMALYDSVLAGFDRADEMADNLFELRTMLQGKVSGSQLRQIAQWNQERATLGEAGTRAALAEHLFHLGKTAFRRGELDRARNALGESLVLCTSAEDYRGAVIALIALGRVCAAADDRQQAAVLLACALAVAEKDGFSPWPPLEEPDFEQHVDEVRRELESHEFEKAWQRGRAMSLGGATALVGVRPL
jgi:non-specific serine/threonine protein kinase